MSSKIDVLMVGYADPVDGKSISNHTEGNKYMKANGSCCLVRSGGHIVMFDTMGPWEKNQLISSLHALNIHPDDVNYLVCSHSHPDHVGNLNLFTNAIRHFIGTSVYSHDTYDLNCFEPTGSYNYITSRNSECVVPQYRNFDLDKNLTIQPTPGHTMECISMIVSNCESLGTVGLVGDLFEREQDVSDEGIWLEAGSQNADLQRANRSHVYNKVNYILPGHGPLFKTKPGEQKRF
jgi:glyoxylase-like metal-dependent hydrolase (beta-lactamase superfamily II)